MCGIAGIIGPDACSDGSKTALARMTAKLAPRGPDEESFWFDPSGLASLGFRRLAILDFQGGHQPVANEDHSVHVVFNGEIYNFVELHQRLEALGHHLSGRGDTATLPHLYEEDGPTFFDRLRGMFAIGVWDSANRLLTLGRDRFGQKPLVYRITSKGQLHFASELKALRAADPDWCPSIDPIALDHYLTLGYIPAPRTIYQDVQKLPAAHYVSISESDIASSRLPAPQSYWQIDWSKRLTIPQLTISEAAFQFRELLESAVQEQNIADVPVGVFLSGGIDSSMIAAISASKFEDRSLRSFSVAFDDTAFDESLQAEDFARKLGLIHTTIKVDFNVWDTLQYLATGYDEPLADNSALPTWLLARETARHLKVVLSGDGGDELALGYDRYRAIALVEKAGKYLPEPVMCFLSGPISERIPVSAKAKTKGRKIQALLQSFGLSETQLLSRWLTYWPESERFSLYRPETLDRLVAESRNGCNSLDPFNFISSSIAKAPHLQWVRHSQMADVGPSGYLCGDLMYKVDIATMAHSLECRSPFLDHRLAEFCASLPVSYLLEPVSCKGKRLFHLACDDIVPKTVFRRKKMGFGAPVDRWLRGPLFNQMTELLSGPDARLGTLLQIEQIKRTLQEHRSGHKDHAYRLWSLLMLELWMREYLNA